MLRRINLENKMSILTRMINQVYYITWGWGYGIIIKQFCYKGWGYGMLRRGFSHTWGKEEGVLLMHLSSC